MALREIHDDELWRIDGFPSFEEYVLWRFNFGERRARYLIAALTLVEAFPAGTIVPNRESQVRERGAAIPSLRRCGGVGLLNAIGGSPGSTSAAGDPILGVVASVEPPAGDDSPTFDEETTPAGWLELAALGRHA